LAIGALFIWLLVKGLDFEALSRALEQTRYELLVPSLALVLAGFAARAYRWKYFFVNDAHIPYRDLFGATMIGYMGNLVLPARAGEFIRAGVISKMQDQLTASKAFATIVAERILDGIVLVALLCFSIFILPFNRPVELPAGTLFKTPFAISRDLVIGLAGGAIGVLAVASLLAVLVHLRSDAVAGFVGRVFSFFSTRAAEHVQRSISSFAEGLHVLRKGRHLTRITLLSVFVWVPAVLAIYPVLHAFPVEFQWPWYTPVVVVAISCIGIMIPASPGFVGTFHAFCVAALLLCAPVEYETAIAFAVVYHAANMIALVAVGVICLWVENVSFLEVARRAESDSAQDAPAG
jgi:uncharacterized protein (TIRG00374 family)